MLKMVSRFTAAGSVGEAAEEITEAVSPVYEAVPSTVIVPSSVGSL